MHFIKAILLLAAVVAAVAIEGTDHISDAIIRAVSTTSLSSSQ